MPGPRSMPEREFRREVDHREAQQFLRRTFRRLFMPILQEHGERAPGLNNVEVRHDRGRVTVTARFSSGPPYNVAIELWELDCYRIGWRDFAHALTRRASEEYSLMFEDFMLHRRERAMRDIYQRAYDRLGPGSERMLHQMMDEARHSLREHTRAFHRRQDRVNFPLARYGRSPAEMAEPLSIAPPDVRYDEMRGYTISRDMFRDDIELTPEQAAPRNITATEVRARQEQAERHYREAEQRMLAATMLPEHLGWQNMMRHLGMAAGLSAEDMEVLLGDTGVGHAEAQKRGMDLLMANLSLTQRDQFTLHKYFDVIGGSSGKTYRIHEGRQMNIAELDKKGASVQGWCFLPQGNLVAGDVMLAQKAALRLFEKKALKIANKFTIHPGSRLWSGPPPPQPELNPIRRGFLRNFIDCDWT